MPVRAGRLPAGPAKSNDLRKRALRFWRHAAVQEARMSNLAQQLAMNVETWGALRRHGVTEQTGLRIDFMYEAPSRSAADKLVKLLREETDYDVAEPRAAGSLLARKFLVSGTTQTTQVSLDILNQWVDWMVAAGQQSEGCIFDGWGAQTP
jgi:hypothetical protein